MKLYIMETNFFLSFSYLNKKLNEKKASCKMSLTSNSISNSYFRKFCMYQHLPNHLVPSLFDSSRNQSLSASLLFLTYYNNKII